jgi:hypothetical protein
MVNLRNSAANAARNAQPAPGGRGQGQGRGRAQPQPQQPPPAINHYHLILMRLGFNAAAITQLENLGMTNLEAFGDISEKDIPSIMKELRRNNILVRQTSQTYMQALRYWVIRRERLQVNFVPEDFTDAKI